MKTAFKTIQNYDCVGVYEQMSDFISILCSLIEIPLPKKLMMINATANRPDASNIIRDLMRNILEMTELDRDFYSQAVGLVKERLEINPTRPPEIPRWMPLDRPISEAKMS